ncbi:MULTISPECIES: hypothetical protein [unclassified Cupriavidus]|uniref:hypothetical protein n=1 Tax=unclassified Cupriavidus TaxID=2640874 RepID=UPI00313AA93C
MAAGSESSCVTVESVQQYQVLLYGVRWPDDPPFALNRASPPRISSCDARVTLRSTAQPQCGKALFSPRFQQPGKIQQFYSYVRQVGSRHDHVVDVSRAFIALWKEGAPWSEAGKYFDCVFAVERTDALAGPGPFEE